MLLRDERQIALSEVETLCMEAADGYTAAAEKADDAELERLFAELAREHGQLAAELAPHIRALDDLPQTPDPDREAVEQAMTGIRAFFSSDARHVLLADREHCERELEQTARAALHQSLPPATSAVLQRIVSHAGEALQRLGHASR